MGNTACQLVSLPGRRGHGGQPCGYQFGEPGERCARPGDPSRVSFTTNEPPRITADLPPTIQQSTPLRPGVVKEAVAPGVAPGVAEGKCTQGNVADIHDWRRPLGVDGAPDEDAAEQVRPGNPYVAAKKAPHFFAAHQEAEIGKITRVT